MTAVYFTYVNHTNKVQLFKRLDLIAEKDQQLKIIEFLTESKNLFDMMAEEDPDYQQQAVLQNSGLMPARMSNMNARSSI
jgi:hypothetical protein